MKRIMAISAIMITTMGAFAQSNTVNPFPKTITVTGSAEIEVVPDEIYVQVDLKEYEKKGQGKIDLEKIKADFLQKVKKIGIPDSAVTIASYDGYTDYYWIRRKKQKKDELYASIAYQIKFSSSSKIDELVNLLDDEATNNFQVVKTSHSKLQEFRKQLKINAVKAAKEKATYLAAAVDETVGAAVSISEMPENIFQPYQYKLGAQSNALYAMDGAAPSATGVEFKKIKMRFEINAVFALK
ncbi:SIMPL domain-containing protein [Pseudoflavitalea sp. G-6-1-2]|uniref:SIMPL domain-containing protein n=1 Tax=Pseudoflavitalea sp. G-6-1-2 TaxID=2728841 RepID=UPI00146B4171|nr:SIMPL domain-containing protein [Pseudoflavitalea sp. G-6-1-2]NML23092.1 SIMPL domain-containing protein [Pseudoflavitalea sp. G-6-1-2]